MGLDLTVIASQAINKGGELRVDIQRFENEESFFQFGAPEGVSHSVVYAFRVPGMEHYAQAELFVPASTAEAPTISIRANQWGSSYKPITEFFKANEIEWQEF